MNYFYLFIYLFIYFVWNTFVILLSRLTFLHSKWIAVVPLLYIVSMEETTWFKTEKNTKRSVLKTKDTLDPDSSLIFIFSPISSSISDLLSSLLSVILSSLSKPLIT